MKRITTAILAFALLLAGVIAWTEGTAPATEKLVAMSADLTEPQAPRVVPGIVQGGGVPVILHFLPRNGEVTVTAYLDEDHALVATNWGEGIVQTQFLRFPGEEYQTWTAYAQGTVKLYPHYYCLGKPTKPLNANDKMEVLEELKSSCFVQVGEETGFVKKQSVGRNPYGYAQEETQPPRQDGGDIVMAYTGSICLLSDVTEQLPTGPAQIKADHVPLIRRYCGAGEAVAILEDQALLEPVEGFLSISEEDMLAYLPHLWVQQEGEPDFRQWEAYAGANSQVYDDCVLDGKPGKTLPGSSRLTVLWDTGEVAYVRYGDDSYGFVSSDTLRTTPISPASSDGQHIVEWTPAVL